MTYRTVKFFSETDIYNPVSIVIPPQTKFGGVYIGITLSVRLFISCPILNPPPLSDLVNILQQLLSMTKGCVMTLTQGHISKVKVTVHTYTKSLSG